MRLHPPAVDRTAPLPGRPSRLGSLFGSGLAAAATFLLIAALAMLAVHIGWNGRTAFSWRFLTAGAQGDRLDPAAAGILPMLVGTLARVLLMTCLVMPAGVLTAIYLHEYAGDRSAFSRMIRRAVNTLAGVPAIIFGLFGLGFFVVFVGGSIDEFLIAGGDEPRWGRPCLLWASCTLAVMTLPVVIVSTDEALRAIRPGLREASLALGATRMQTILRVVLPEALPGILTGGIFAVSRAAGEVAPLLFTGAAYFMARLPRALNEQFMDLGYHAFILATQTPNPEATRPVLYGTLTVLLLLTLALNAIGMLIRLRVRRAHATAHD